MYAEIKHFTAVRPHRSMNCKTRWFLLLTFTFILTIVLLLGFIHTKILHFLYKYISDFIYCIIFSVKSQNFTYTMLDFAFEILESNFWDRLPQTSQNVAWSFSYSSWQNWRNSVRFVILLSQTLYFTAVHKLSMGFRSGVLSWPATPILSLCCCLCSHFVPTLEVCLGSLFCWKTQLQPSFNFVTDLLRFCFIISK